LRIRRQSPERPARCGICVKERQLNAQNTAPVLFPGSYRSKKLRKPLPGTYGPGDSSKAPRVPLPPGVDTTSFKTATSTLHSESHTQYPGSPLSHCGIICRPCARRSPLHDGCKPEARGSSATEFHAGTDPSNPRHKSSGQAGRHGYVTLHMDTRERIYVEMMWACCAGRCSLLPIYRRNALLCRIKCSSDTLQTMTSMLTFRSTGAPAGARLDGDRLTSGRQAVLAKHTCDACAGHASCPNPTLAPGVRDSQSVCRPRGVGYAPSSGDSTSSQSVSLAIRSGGKDLSLRALSLRHRAHRDT
jgi:hypothetical protein